MKKIHRRIVNRKRTIGYLRVSTSDQDNDKFKHEIYEFSNKRNLGQIEWIEEKISGTKSWKERRLGSILNELTEGDSIIVPEMSRLGRSMLDILEILKVAEEKGVNIYALKGNFELNGSLESKVIAAIFSLMAEVERDLISIRTKEALAARKANGAKLGRPKGPGKSKLDKYKLEIVALLNNGSTKTFIAKRYNTSIVNLINWLKKNNLCEGKKHIRVS